MPGSQEGLNRGAGYRYGSWLALHGSGAHLVGFSTSCWLTREANHSMGLWTSCQDSRCTALSAEDVPGWFQASRVVSCLGVVLVTLWLMAGCQSKCLRSRQQRHRWVVHLEELLAISSGCVALFSAGLFAIASARDSTLGQFSLGWSLWLVVGGASACTVGGAIVAGTRGSAHLAPKPCTRSIQPLTTPPESGTGDSASSQEQRCARGELLRRNEDVADIFNVASTYTRNSSSFNSGRRTRSPLVVRLVGPLPPPYWAAGGDLHPEMGRDRSGRNPAGRSEPSTQIHELSLSPPPSYEVAMNEQPPPYEPVPDYPTEGPEVRGSHERAAPSL